MAKNSIEIQGLQKEYDCKQLYVSGNAYVSGTLKVAGLDIGSYTPDKIDFPGTGQYHLNSINSDLILTSSNGSSIVVSGNLNVMGGLTATGISIDVSGSNNFFVEDTLDARGVVTNTLDDLILSSSATSNIIVSGNMNILGTLTATGISADPTGSTNFFVDDTLNAKGKINNTTGRLILSSSIGSIINASSSLDFSNTDKNYHIRSVNSDLILSSSTGSKVIVSGNLSILGSVEAASGITVAVTGATNLFADTTLDARGILNNTTGHLILSSSVGSIVALSSSLDFPNSDKNYHIRAVNSNLILSSTAGSVVAFSASQDFTNTDKNYHIRSVNSDLILNSNGRKITVSGTFDAIHTASFGPYLRMGTLVTGNLGRPTPTNIAHSARFYAPTGSAAAEATAIYIQTVHGTGGVDFNYGIYGDIPDTQHNTGGSFTKVYHKGEGDAHYVAIANPTSGYGYEAALFGSGGVGFIATFQGGGGYQDSVLTQSNVVGFTVLQANDGENPGFVPSYGLFYANNCMGNALTVKCSEFAAAGTPQLRVVDKSYNRRWAVYTDGDQHLVSMTATDGETLQNSPQLQFFGSYWNAASASAYPVCSTIKAIATETPSSKLYFYTGEYAEQEITCIFSTSSIDLQNNDITSVRTIKFYEDNSTDFGIATNSRPKNIYAGSSFVVGTTGSVYANNGHLILSSSVGSIITISSSLSFANSGKKYHIRSVDEDLVLSSSSTSKLVFSGSNLTFTDQAISNASNINNRTGHLILSSSAGSVVTLSSSIDLPGVGSVYHIRSTNDDLILSSSNTSLIVVSGNLSVLGGLSAAGISIDVTGSTNFFASDVLDARGVINNTTGHLILSCSKGSKVVISASNIDFVEDAPTRAGNINNRAGHLILSSSAGSVVSLSSSLDLSRFDKTYHIRSVNSHLIFTASDGSRVTISGSSLQITDEAPYLGGHMVAKSSHLILSSSGGSTVAVSGALMVRDGIYNASGKLILSSSYGSAVVVSGSLQIIDAPPTSAVLIAATASSVAGQIVPSPEIRLRATYFDVDATASATKDVVFKNDITENSGSQLRWVVDGVNVLLVESTGLNLQNKTTTAAGQFNFYQDNTVDIGASTGYRPKSVFAGSSFVVGTTGSVYANNSHLILSSSAGSIVTSSGAFKVTVSNGANAILLEITASTGANQVVDSPEIRFRGHYWDNTGGVDVTREAIIKNVVTAASASSFRFYVDGITPMIVTTTGLDLQNKTTTSAGPIRFYFDNVSDIGQAASTRPRRVYVASEVIVGTTGSVWANGGHLVLSSSVGSIVAISGALKTGRRTVATLPAGSDSLSGTVLWVTNDANGPCLAVYGPAGWTRILTGSVISA